MKRLISSMTLQIKKQEAPATPEAKAIAEIGSVRALAQNDDRVEVSFQLQGAAVSDKDLAALTQLKKVASVNLGKTSITDAGLAALARLTGITSLHLEQTGTGVTDAGLAHLAGLSNLKSLYLWQTKVTPEGAKKRKESLPKADINLGWDTAPPAKR